MSDLSPVAFDIETTGFDPTDSVITVAGLAHDLGVTMVLNTGGRRAFRDELIDVLDEHGEIISFTLCDDEVALLDALAANTSRLDGDNHYLTAFNGETWNGGFDLAFLRSRCVFAGARWPFPDIAYADTMEAVERFATADSGDLVGTYDLLIGSESCDPFEDSAEAVDAWKNGDWAPLLLHNLADIQRTRELAVLAERYVASTDFSMKNLTPPGR